MWTRVGGSTSGFLPAEAKPKAKNSRAGFQGRASVPLRMNVFSPTFDINSASLLIISPHFVERRELGSQVERGDLCGHVAHCGYLFMSAPLLSLVPHFLIFTGLCVSWVALRGLLWLPTYFAHPRRALDSKEHQEIAVGPAYAQGSRFGSS